MTYRSNAIDVDALHDRLEDLGEVWADADAAYKALDDMTKSVLSRCMVPHEGKSVAAAETLARRDEVFVSHLNSLAEARKNANRARVKYDSAKAWIELYRSKAATEREAMKLR
jgi:hypothetical protein